MAGLQSFTECGFIDESPTGAIHNANAFFANSQSAGVEHVAGLIGEWHVHAYEIGLRKERVDVFDEFHLHATSAAYREVGIVGQYTHAKGHGAAGEFGADASHAENAERLIVKLNTFIFFTIPLAGFDAGVGLRDVAGDTHEEREGMLGGRDRVAAGGVHDDHAMAGGGVHIDVVHTDSGAADDLELRGSFENGCGDLGLAANDEG